MSTFRPEQLRQPLSLSGSFTGSFSGSFSGSLEGTASYATTASYAMNGGGGAGVSYITQSGPFSLTGIEVADYSNDVAVTFINNTLKFIFGTPVSQSITSFSFNSTFDTDRFNQELDSYTASAVWANNGYTLVSASIFTGSVLLANTGSGTTLEYTTNLSGSQSYILYVTASSPLDNSIRVISQSLAGTLSKINPGNPTQTETATVQLGAGSNQMEQGATGSVAISSTTGSANRWTITSFTSTGSFSSTRIPLFGNANGAVGSNTLIVTGSITGSNNIIIATTASYTSGILNSPASTVSVNDSITYSKIRSVRYGASVATSYTQAQLGNLALWDTTLGGSIGTIAKGTVNPNGYQFTVTTSAQYIYIVIDANYTLTGILNVNNSFSNDINVFTLTTVGLYSVYRSNNLSSTTILYELRT